MHESPMESRLQRWSRFLTSEHRAQEGPGELSSPPAGPDADTRYMLDYRLAIFLWFLFLFEPARLITFYVPALRPIKWIPELLLYAACIRWFFSSAPKRYMKWFTAFFGVTIFGTVIAFVFGNWGIARLIVRQLFQYYALGILTLSFCATPLRTSKILRLYFFSFLYYAVWGLISLKMAPIESDIDPGARQIVFWHPYFDNRDGFGPLMVMGFAFSFYFYKALRGRLMKLLATATAIFCITGIIISFGRGVFLAFIATIGYVWIKTKRKLVMAIALVVVVLVFMNAFPDIAHRYWATMQTISTEGTEGGTGLDRKILWGWAWREFLSSPIFGVGTGNFGIAVFRVVSYGEALEAGYTPGRLWGRALHCAPLTILSEYGLIGAAIMWFLFADVLKRNRQTRKNATRFANPSGASESRNNLLFRPSAVVAVSNGLNAAILAILVSSFLYELLIAPLFWHLIIINQLLYLVSTLKPPGESQLA
jgi:hypothetical protein